MDLLFQSTVPTGTPKRASDILSDAFKETISERQASRCREASAEHEETVGREVHAWTDSGSAPLALHLDGIALNLAWAKK